VDDTVQLAVSLLNKAGVRLESGLSEAELGRIENRFGFTFCAVHRRLLASVLPAGSVTGPNDLWPDWRSGSDDELRARLTWPIDGVVFDVVNNGFWANSWGPRPAQAARAEASARERLRAVPQMVPIYGHRYLPAEPAPEDPAVFSIYQTDVIYYGENLADYVAREFHLPRRPAPVTADRRTPFWSDLAEGAGPTAA